MYIAESISSEHASDGTRSSVNGNSPDLMNLAFSRISYMVEHVGIVILGK